MSVEEIFGLLLLPLSYGFMVRGLLAALIVGLICAVVGTFVVVRGMAFIGGELSHAVLPGVAVAYLSGGNIFFGALAAAVASALSIGLIQRTSKLKEDTAIGIILAGFFALGVLLMSTVRGGSGDLTSFLFGNVLGVSTGDLLFTAAIGGGIVLLIVLFLKELVTVAFDPILAETLGLSVALFDYGFLVLLAVTVVVSMQTVGVILVLAMLVTPAATAFLLTTEIRRLMLIASGIGMFSAVVGLYVSFYANVASGPAIVLTAVAIFALVWLAAPGEGVLTSALLRRIAGSRRPVRPAEAPGHSRASDL